MSAVKSLERKLNELLVQKAPVQIPTKGRQTLVRWFPWIALIFGVLQLLAGLELWRLARTVDKALVYTNALAEKFNVQTPQPNYNFFFWLSLIVLVISGAVLLAAYSGLRDRRKTGWNLLFYGSLLNFVYGLLFLFSGGDNVALRFIGSLISTTIGLYILFQIRSYYSSKPKT